jgi:hypothetical protein
LEEEAKYWSKDYTNEHIREQIKENSQMFSLIIGILAFALFIILLSFFIAYIKKAPDNRVWGILIILLFGRKITEDSY